MPGILAEPEEGVLLRFETPDGRWVDLTNQIFNMRISIGPANSQTYTEFYCYRDRFHAMNAFLLLRHDPTTEPTGWVRHVPSARRRPDGDPAKEYVRE